MSKKYIIIYERDKDDWFGSVVDKKEVDYWKNMKENIAIYPHLSSNNVNKMKKYWVYKNDIKKNCHTINYITLYTYKPTTSCVEIFNEKY